MYLFSQSSNFHFFFDVPPSDVACGPPLSIVVEHGFTLAVPSISICTSPGRITNLVTVYQTVNITFLRHKAPFLAGTEGLMFSKSSLQGTQNITLT